MSVNSASSRYLHSNATCEKHLIAPPEQLKWIAASSKWLHCACIICKIYSFYSKYLIVFAALNCICTVILTLMRALYDSIWCFSWFWVCNNTSSHFRLRNTNSACKYTRVFFFNQFHFNNVSCTMLYSQIVHMLTTRWQHCCSQNLPPLGADRVQFAK